MSSPVFDAVVLAGGSARRLGGVAKPQLVVDGVSLLDRVVGAVSDAARVVVAGPVQPLSASREVTWVREAPSGGGPVAALAAALPATSAPLVVVLAADLPWVAPAVPRLLDSLVAVRNGPDPAANTAVSDSDKRIGDPAAERHDVAVLVDAGGRVNHLAAAWRRDALLDALARIDNPNGAPARTLLDGLDPVRVRDDGGWGADCDTWDDVHAARRADRAATEALRNEVDRSP